MRQLLVSELQPNTVLGRTVYSERGDVLLRRGVTLTPRFVEALKTRGFYAVHVFDGNADDVVPQDIVSEQVRVVTARHVRELFDLARRNAIQNSTENLAESIERFAAKATPLVSQLYRDVESIIEDILSSETLSGMTSLKSQENYAFEHSVEVTVAAVLLGKRLNLSPDDLRILAFGCLLHDIGSLLVPPEVLEKPGRLSKTEYALVKQHAQFGYEVSKMITSDHSIMARHIVWQHHEHQDGSGYPRGLRGNNELGVGKRMRFEPGRIAPAAEIAAVADVYSAMASDRPFRPSLDPSAIVNSLQRMAGHHLNRELVKRFLLILPPFPVGHGVTLVGGRLQGYRGVVTAINPSSIDRPVIRILFDEKRCSVAPFEVDTAVEPEHSIAIADKNTPYP